MLPIINVWPCKHVQSQLDYSGPKETAYMKYFIFVLLLTLLSVPPCMAVNLRLMTGPEQGTYYQVGQEIAEQTEKVGLHLEVIPTEGSWANIVGLFNNDTEFAIFQIDAFLQAAKNLYNNKAEDIHDEIKVVMPLYNEEIHVIKSKARELDFASEEHFVIGCGRENSGSCLSAGVIADFYGKEFNYVYDDYENALDDLREDKLDLVIITSGKPNALLVDQTGLDLVSLPRTRKAAELYLYTDITADDYPWLEQTVETYAVLSVLATMIQEQEGLANDLVGTLHFAMQVNEDKLKQYGHPKWRDVFFTRYIESVGHVGALQSIGVCRYMKRYGHRCSELVSNE
jgi:TRAP transporter TAXI family solute receptor